MQDSINTIISNALIVNKDILSKNIKPIINQSQLQSIIVTSRIPSRKKSFRVIQNKQSSTVFLEFDKIEFETDFAEVVYSKQYEEMERIIISISKDVVPSIHSLFSIMNKSSYPKLNRLILICISFFLFSYSVAPIAISSTYLQSQFSSNTTPLLHTISVYGIFNYSTFLIYSKLISVCI